MSPYVLLLLEFWPAPLSLPTHPWPLPCSPELAVRGSVHCGSRSHPVADFGCTGFPAARPRAVGPLAVWTGQLQREDPHPMNGPHPRFPNLTPLPRQYPLTILYAPSRRPLVSRARANSGPSTTPTPFAQEGLWGADPMWVKVRVNRH